MKRWSKRDGGQVEDPRIDAFLADVLAVCLKHKLSLSHEDEHGAFVVVNLGAAHYDWLSEAHIGMDVEQ